MVSSIPTVAPQADMRFAVGQMADALERLGMLRRDASFEEFERTLDTLDRAYERAGDVALAIQIARGR